MKEKIKRMLEYLTKDKDNTQIIYIDKGVYHTKYLFPIDDVAARTRDVSSVTIDTVNEKVSWWASDEHPHSGNYYNQVKGELPYESIYDKLLELCTTKSRKAAAKQMEEERLKLIKERAEKILHTVLTGHE